MGSFGLFGNGASGSITMISTLLDLVTTETLRKALLQLGQEYVGHVNNVEDLLTGKPPRMTSEIQFTLSPKLAESYEEIETLPDDLYFDVTGVNYQSLLGQEFNVSVASKRGADIKLELKESNRAAGLWGTNEPRFSITEFGWYSEMQADADVNKLVGLCGLEAVQSAFYELGEKIAEFQLEQGNSNKRKDPPLAPIGMWEVTQETTVSKRLKTMKVDSEVSEGTSVSEAQ